MEETVIQPMEHTHPVIDDDPHFIINPDTREISHTSPDSLVLIQGDHMSERYTFEIPKTIDGHEMSLCNDVQIHFINVNGNNSAEYSSNVYRVEDFNQELITDETIKFSWLISQSATLFAGTLSFAVRFICRDENAQVQYVWNTAPFSSVKISNGIDTGEEIVEAYNNILESWYNNLVHAGTTSLEAIEEAKNTVVNTDIPNAREAAKQEIELYADEESYNYIKRVKETAPADLLNVKNLLVQTSGQNPDKIMSQKAVSDALDELDSNVSGANTRAINNLREDIDDIKNTFAELGTGRMLLEEVAERVYLLGDINREPDITSNKLRVEEYEYYILGYNHDESSIVMQYDILVATGGVYKTEQVRIENFIELDEAIGPTHEFKFKIASVSYSEAVPDTSWDIWVNVFINGHRYFGHTRVEQAMNPLLRNIVFAAENVDKVYVYPRDPSNTPALMVNVKAIADVTKTATNGLTDTYTISFNDGTTKTFEIQNGVSVSSIERTDRGDYEDTYTIYFNNGTSTTFKTPNGGQVGIKKTATGNIISIDDISPIEHGVGVKVKNKNLIPQPYQTVTRTLKGITITENADGSFTANGTATGECVWFILDNGTEHFKGAYTFSGISGGSPTTYYAQMVIDGVYQDAITEPVTCQLDGVLTRVGFYVKTGAVLDNMTFKLQLEEGTTATEYVPYVEPTLMKVYACGENIVSYPYHHTSRHNNGIEFTDFGEGHIGMKGTSTDYSVFFIDSGNLIFEEGVEYKIAQPNTPRVEMIIAYTDETGSDKWAKSILKWNSGYNYKNTYIQVEPDVTVDEVYIPYITSGQLNIYTPNHDGTVPGVTSISPKMTIFTDAAGAIIEARYNEDIPHFVEKFVGDVESAVDSILALQKAIIYGELAYTLSTDGKYYTCTGKGTYKLSDIVIPDNIYGIPVKYISDGAFKNDTTITSVTIGKNIDRIGTEAFLGCTGVTAVYLTRENYQGDDGKYYTYIFGTESNMVTSNYKPENTATMITKTSEVNGYPTTDEWVWVGVW